MEDEMPTLVLMPGLDGTGLLFEHFVSALPPHIRTLIIEYPKVSAPLEEYAAVVAETLPAGRVVLLAESFSGIVALYLLRKHHVQAEKVIFVASFGSTPRRYLRMLLPFFSALGWAMPLIPSAAWRFFCLGAGATGADIAWLKGVLAQVNPRVVAHRLKLVAAAKIADAPRSTFQRITSKQRGIVWSRVVRRTTCEGFSAISPCCAFRGRISCCRRPRLSLLNSLQASC